ncbi:NDR1/HIN1-like protein 12 [Linum perenne]
MSFFDFIRNGAEKAYAFITGEHYTNRRQYYNQPSFRRILCWIFLGSLALLGIIAFITWAVLRPTAPTFTLQYSPIYAFNDSTPNVLTSNFHVTFSTRNPNRRIGIYYDALEVYAQYRDQQITRKAQVPAFYQGHKESNVWSPLVYGNEIPVSPYNAAALGLDRVSGSVPVVVKMDGRVRFKVGGYVSRHYGLHVRCMAYVQSGDKNGGVVGGFAVGNDGVKYLVGESCSVSV